MTTTKPTKPTTLAERLLFLIAERDDAISNADQYYRELHAAIARAETAERELASATEAILRGDREVARLRKSIGNALKHNAALKNEYRIPESLRIELETVLGESERPL